MKHRGYVLATEDAYADGRPGIWSKVLDWAVLVIGLAAFVSMPLWMAMLGVI